MSVRRYFSFLVLFAVIFTFVAVVTLDINIGEETRSVVLEAQNISSNAYGPYGESVMLSAPAKDEAVYCVIGQNGVLLRNIVNTLESIKKPYVLHETLEEIDVSIKHRCVILAGNSYSADEISLISEIAENGTPVIFAEVPQRNLIMNSEFRKITGIYSFGSETEEKSFHVIDGFLFGGRMTYDKTPTKCSELALDFSCKVFIRVDDKENGLKNEEQIPLLWRNYYQGVPVYVFNNTFLYGNEGAGCLVSVLSQLEDVYVYPIISSFSVSFLNFPLGDTFSDNAQLIYNRDTLGSIRDIVFPDLVHLSSKTGIYFTFFLRSDDFRLSNWENEMRKQDYSFYKDPSGSAAAALASIATETEFSSADNKDFLNRSSITGFGLVLYAADIEQIFDPLPENSWRLLQKDFAEKITAIHNLYPWLDKQKYNQAVESLNNYYAIEPSIMVSNDSLRITCENFNNSATFIARIKDNKVVESSKDAAVIEIEKGVYKITLTAPDVTLAISDNLKREVY